MYPWVSTGRLHHNFECAAPRLFSQRDRRNQWAHRITSSMPGSPSRRRQQQRNQIRTCTHAKIATARNLIPGRAAPTATAAITVIRMRRWALLAALVAARATPEQARSGSGSSPAAWHYFENSNAAASCGDVSNCIPSRGPCRCFGHFHTVELCSSACAAAPNCTVVTYIDGNCWNTVDNAWQPSSNGGSVAACLNGSVPGCTPPPPSSGTSILAVVNTSAPVLRTHALSPAVTLDFWNASMPGVDPSWTNATTLSLDLANPLLRALASQLAPGILRLGGSPEDGVWYDADGTCVPDSGGGGPSSTYYCSQGVTLRVLPLQGVG